MSARILVIRLSALGDIVLSFGPFAAIRARHADAHIAVLTTAPFAPMLAASGWFDDVLVDARPAVWDVRGLLRLRRQLRGFDLVYDLQTSSRSARYFGLAGKPPWSGVAAGCSLPHHDPGRDFAHTLERQRGQLGDAGVTDFPAPDLTFLRAGGPVIAAPYVVLVAGNSGAHGGGKTWPAENFAALAMILATRGHTPVLVGSRADQAVATPIMAAEPRAINLTGQTTLLDLAGVLARAHAAVGADTGPMHLAAALGTPSIVLFGPATHPALTAPRGPTRATVTVLRANPLADLPPDRVAAALANL